MNADQTPPYRPFVNRRYDPAKDPANIAASTGPDEPTHPSMADPDLMANAEGDKKALRRARDLKQPASASPDNRRVYDALDALVAVLRQRGMDETQMLAFAAEGGANGAALDGLRAYLEMGLG